MLLYLILIFILKLYILFFATLFIYCVVVDLYETHIENKKCHKNFGWGMKTIIYLIYSIMWPRFAYDFIKDFIKGIKK